tara:strand:- start:432 stop:950 length:519 start_codon:yes stop_codon:yes gene_type:complete
MPITEENKIESIAFINALNDMLEIIDNIAPLITDNNYLQLCNNLKILNDNNSKETLIQYVEVIRTRIRNNAVVQNQEARTRMKCKTKNEMLTDAEKLKRGWKVCYKCDRIVLNIHTHHYSDVCKRTTESKKLTFKSNSITTDKYISAIHILRAIFISYNGYKYYMKFIKNRI